MKTIKKEDAFRERERREGDDGLVERVVRRETDFLNLLPP